MEIPASEEFLLARCRKRDPQALRELADRYGPRLYAFALWACGGSADAARRRTLTALGRAVRESEEPRAPVFLHTLLLLCRFVSENSPCSEVEGEDPRVRMMLRALFEIPADDRRLILLRDQMRLSYPEIEAVLALPQAVVRRRLSSAREAFLAAMQNALKNESRGRA